MLIPVALIAFWPSPVDQPVQAQLATTLYVLHRHGVPVWVDYKLVEATANVLLFLPLGVLGSLAFPTKFWWQVGALGSLLSGCIELGQLLFLHDRFAALSDIVTNTAGATTGALLVMSLRRKLRARADAGDSPPHCVT
ncbi:VanZ family protein [Arthrobacter sp. ISL-85]|nr:VanZ family protein [Arthrobacter sp. ISL-85]